MSVFSITPRTRSASETSYATTPEPSSPISSLHDHDCLPPVAPFEHRPYYDETILPALPDTEEIPPQQPSSLDAGTPDHWVARDDRLVRLTGRHPFNAEPALSTLFSRGFLTPQNLFYVRNHGAVPKVTSRQARDWRLRVHGLVEREVSFSVQELKERFPVVTLPVTLVCAGNRRKEQNMVAKGLGFNWGAAGVSTGLFTGVYLADIIDYCRAKNPLLSAYPETVVPGRARHVIFEGADELPKGRYGTSQRLSWAMDREKGMLVAWGMNGEDLSPDHGFPLRLVVPGQIGGRMVKWLNRIEISDRESQHHLHFFDNKVLPTQVSADEARTENKWWYDPKYILNELNVNAAICYPDHDHLLEIASETPSAHRQILPLQGYAYTGGGRRVTRVEVTLDDGQTWQLADVSYPEDLYRIHPIQDDPYFGKLDLSMTDMSFSWCFWRLDLDLQSLVGRDVKMIAVRAVDESLQTMPRDMYWNATSMMNSWWFRVAVHRDMGGRALRFEHPAPVAGSNPRGWMKRMKESGLDPRFPKFGGDSPYDTPSSFLPVPAAASAPREESGSDDTLQEMINPDKVSTIITAAEFAQHSGSDAPEPWFVVHGQVYDGTPFLESHPGGAESIRIVAGEDATEDFMAIHSRDSRKMMRDFHLGVLEATNILTPKSSAPSALTPDDPDVPFLEPKKWKKTQLVSRRHISHDTRMFRFALSHKDQLLGLPVGQHVYLRVKKTNKQTGKVEIVQRAYTPYSGDSQRGYLDILIKVYFPSVSASSQLGVPATSFAGGKMTMLLESMPIGAGSDEWAIELKGPVGQFTYLGDRQVQWKPAKAHRRIRKLAMVAGGSGITPVLSTLKAIAAEYLARDPSQEGDHIQVSLLYGNRTEEDILVRDELDALARVMEGNLKVWHVLSSDSVRPDWEMGRGHIDLECLRQHLPPPPAVPSDGELEDTLALVCGPPMMEKGVKEALCQLGWDTERTTVFF